jgi:DUF1680 family protein
MPARLLEAHPWLFDNGRAALQRGPLIYCLEAADHPGVDAWDLRISPNAEWTAEHRPELLGGVTALKTTGAARNAGAEWDGELYRTLRPPDANGLRSVEVTAIPYYAWANREPGPMQVWIPLLGDSPVGETTGFAAADSSL